jgi:hypothetical protein
LIDAGFAGFTAQIGMAGGVAVRFLGARQPAVHHDALLRRAIVVVSASAFSTRLSGI